MCVCVHPIKAWLFAAGESTVSRSHFHLSEVVKVLLFQLTRSWKRSCRRLWKCCSVTYTVFGFPALICTVICTVSMQRQERSRIVEIKKLCLNRYKHHDEKRNHSWVKSDTGIITHTYSLCWQFISCLAKKENEKVVQDVEKVVEVMVLLPISGEVSMETVKWQQRWS